MTSPQPAKAQGLRRYAVSYGLAWLVVALVVGPGSAALVKLTGRIETAGIFVTIYALAAAGGGLAGGQAMDRWGRRRVIAAAHVLAAAGLLVSGAAVQYANLPLFVMGVLALSFGIATALLARLACAEFFPPDQRGRGVAYAQLHAAAGAVLGPLLLVGLGPVGTALNFDPWNALWFIAAPLLILASVLVLGGVDPHMAIPRGAAAATPTPMSRGAKQALFVGIVALALAHSAMVMAMGVTGAAMKDHGHTLANIGLVISLHFLGMFALSTYIGRIADRIGRRATILIGAAVLATGGLIFATSATTFVMALGLFTIGLGWSFAFLGGTVLVTDVAPKGFSGRILGRADLATALLVSVVATSGGWVYASRGLVGLGLLAAIMVLIPMAGAWALRETQPGRYMETAPALEPIA